MASDSGFADTHFKILDRQDQRFIRRGPPWQSTEMLTHLVDFIQRVTESAVALIHQWQGKFTRLFGVTQGGGGTPDHLRRLAYIEAQA